MKKCTLILLVLLLSSASLNAQNAFYDAKSIDSLLKSGRDNNIRQAISLSLSYFKTTDNNINVGEYYRLMNKSVLASVNNYILNQHLDVPKVCELCVDAKSESIEIKALVKLCDEINNLNKLISESRLKNVDLDSFRQIKQLELKKLSDSLDLLNADTSSIAKNGILKDSIITAINEKSNLLDI